MTPASHNRNRLPRFGIRAVTETTPGPASTYLYEASTRTEISPRLGADGRDANAVSSARVLRGGGKGAALCARGRGVLCIAARAFGVDCQARKGTGRHADQPRAQLRGPDPGGRAPCIVGQ